LTSFRRAIRNTLCIGIMTDFDLSNAHPCIVQNICREHGIPCPMIDRYISDREAILAEISAAYFPGHSDPSYCRRIAKRLMLRLCFFGSVKGFKAEEGLGMLPDEIDPPFLSAFSAELTSIALVVKGANPQLYDSARKCKQDIADRANKNLKPGEKQQQAFNVLGSMFARYLQDLECRIVGQLMEYLDTETRLFRAHFHVPHMSSTESAS
jgi:hypothetical protein